MVIRATHLSAKSVRQRGARRDVYKYIEHAPQLVSRFGTKIIPAKQALLGLGVCGE